MHLATCPVELVELVLLVFDIGTTQGRLLPASPESLKSSSSVRHFMQVVNLLLSLQQKLKTPESLFHWRSVKFFGVSSSFIWARRSFLASLVLPMLTS